MIPGCTIDLALYRTIRLYQAVTVDISISTVTARNKSVSVNFDRRRLLPGDINLAAMREEETSREKKRKNQENLDAS